MRILISGANGFVGSVLVKSLLKTYDQLSVVTRSPKSHIFDVFKARLNIINVLNSDWKSEVRRYNPDVVIHLAAYLTSMDNENAIDKLIESNISFGTHLLDALKGTTMHTFINTGSFSEYSHNNDILIPAYLYAATKSAFRDIIKYYQYQNAFKVIHVIPYTIYGGIDNKKKLIDLIYLSLNSVSPLNLSPGYQKLDFIHLNDVINFYLHLLGNLDEIDTEEIVCHLGTCIGSTPRQIAKVFERLTGKKANINWGGIPYRYTDTMYSVAPESEFIKKINWHAKVSLEEGIALYIKEQMHNGI